MGRFGRDGEGVGGGRLLGVGDGIGSMAPSSIVHCGDIGEILVGEQCVECCLF